MINFQTTTVSKDELLTQQQLQLLEEQLKNAGLLPESVYSKNELETRLCLPLFEKLLKQSDEIAFSLHRKQSTYQKEFFLSHQRLILTAYKILALQVKNRLIKAQSQRVRSSMINMQIEKEKEELSRLDQEQKKIETWNPDDFWSQQDFFHYKGCFYHVCTACQKLLYALNENRFSQPMLLEALLIAQFYSQAVSDLQNQL